MELEHIGRGGVGMVVIVCVCVCEGGSAAYWVSKKFFDDGKCSTTSSSSVVNSFSLIDGRPGRVDSIAVKFFCEQKQNTLP